MKSEALYLGSKFFFSYFTRSLWGKNPASLPVANIYEPLSTEYKFLEWTVPARSSIILNSFIMTSNAPFFSSLNFLMYVNNTPFLKVNDCSNNILPNILEEQIPLNKSLNAGDIVSFAIQHEKLGFIEPNDPENIVETIDPLFFTFHIHGMIQYE